MELLLLHNISHIASKLYIGVILTCRHDVHQSFERDERRLFVRRLNTLNSVSFVIGYEASVPESVDASSQQSESESTRPCSTVTLVTSSSGTNIQWIEGFSLGRMIPIVSIRSI